MNADTLGYLTLLPAVVAIAAAIWTHRPVESLLAGVVTALLLNDPATAIPTFSETLLSVMMDETIAWVIIVCGLIGSIIVLLMRSGAAFTFADAVSKRVTSRRGALLSTWLLGIAIFIDDYLNALSVGSSMRPVTDRYKVSRPMLAYVVDSTAAPVCMLIPLSTWAVFFSGVLEESNVAAEGEGLLLFISSIPYMLYCWFALALVFLVAGGWFPAIGPMRRYEAAARIAEKPPEDPEEIERKDLAEPLRPTGLYHFAVPMLCLVGFSLWYDIDVQIGTILALTLTIALFGLQKILPWPVLLDSVLDGVKVMIPALATVVMAFMFKATNDAIGMPQFVIETVQPYMSTSLVPVISFLTLAALAFATGSSWGIFVIAIPVVMPLGAAAGVDTALMVGAVMSASAFGSHACFYSDATVLAAQGAGCGVMEHALTQLPYVLIAATASAVGLWLLA